jgi:uridine kinase
MTDRTGSAPVHRSVSTWQQPTPAAASTKRSALVGAVAERILGRDSGRLRVGIDGYTAAGKTSFGHELADHISAAGRPVQRASLDDLKRPWRERHLYDRESRLLPQRLRLRPHSVAAARARRPGRIRGLCVVRDRSADAARPHRYRDRSVGGRRPDIDPSLSIRRGAVRDCDWAGSEAETIHRERYGPAEQLYVAEVDPRRLVDVVIDNSDFEHPRIV